jgi:hypothetical protein
MLRRVTGYALRVTGYAPRVTDYALEGNRVCSESIWLCSGG